MEWSEEAFEGTFVEPERVETLRGTLVLCNGSEYDFYMEGSPFEIAREIIKMFVEKQNHDKE